MAIQAKLERQKSHNEMPLSYKKEEALDQLKKNIQVRNQLQLEIDGSFLALTLLLTLLIITKVINIAITSVNFNIIS